MALDSPERITGRRSAAAASMKLRRSLLALTLIAIAGLLLWASSPTVARAQTPGCLGLEQDGAEVQAGEIARLLNEHKAVICHDVTIRGALDISDVGAVTETLIIENSTLDSIRAQNVEFRGRFSMASSNVRMSDDYRAHREPSPDSCAAGGYPGSPTADGTADFTGSRFDDAASFAFSCFEGQFTLKDTEFRGRADFQFAEFHANQTLSIDDTLFAEANFTGARFTCKVQFRTVSAQTIRLPDAALLYQNDESDLQYCGRRNTEDWNLRFVGTQVSGLLDLTAVEFLTTLNIDGRFWGSLRMDPRDSQRILDPKVRDGALREIERTSRASGDIGTANAALWALRDSEQASLPPVAKQLSVFFWEWVGGFLIRPWHPLLSFAVLLSLGVGGSLLRVQLRRRRLQRRARRLLQRLVRRRTKGQPTPEVLLGEVGGYVGAALKPMLSPKPSLPGRWVPRRYWRNLEYLIQYAGGKYLTVAFFLALATSSPTFEPIVRALIPVP